MHESVSESSTCDSIYGDFIPLEQLSYVNGKPENSALLKQELTDFRVNEELGFSPTGSGDHLFVRVRKTDVTTTDAARRLAAVSGLSLRHIGYSGMKDRRGECTQWFSVPMAISDERLLVELEDPSLEILETRRNSRKLKIGSHKRNHFEILLRQCSGAPAEFEEKLGIIKRCGVPNYFGSQRFGRDMGNLAQLVQLFEDEQQAISGGEKINTSRRGKGSHKRGMLFSAARAYLFNQVLSERIQRGSWSAYVAGDVLNLDGTTRFFAVEAGAWDTHLQQRLESFDIHITGPLAGATDPKERYVSRAEAADIEDAVLAQFTELVRGLKAYGLQSGRRPMRCNPQNLAWQWLSPGELKLGFTLPSGAYATSLLRELCITN